MTDKVKPVDAAQGDRVFVASDPVDVVGPDGVQFQIVGGAYVLDRPGVHLVAGVAYKVK
jgi:sensor domain CHASE-containing protein